MALSLTLSAVAMPFCHQPCCLRIQVEDPGAFPPLFTPVLLRRGLHAPVYHIFPCLARHR